MTLSINIAKRDGRLEPLALDKVLQTLTQAASGLSGIDCQSLAQQARQHFVDGISSSAVQETLIKVAADNIDEQRPDYQYLAARLAIFNLRKKAFGDYQPPRLYQHVVAQCEANRYDRQLLANYSETEFEQMDAFIDHQRDLSFAYAAVKQLEGKYLLQNRITGEIYESPQFLYLLIAASLFAHYDKSLRLQYVERFYHAISTFKISLPTPIMAGVRTPTRQFSSCVLIECGDSLASINETSASIVTYVSQRAGIGINAGRIRAIGSPIRGGQAFHTGCVPFYKHFQSAVKCCSQGGVRGGAATVFYPIWHLEVEDLLVLKNNRGVEENRIRQLDYGVQLSKLFYQRLIQDGLITLFSPADVPDLYDAFFADPQAFEALYVRYEQDPSIRKKQLKASELFSTLMQERASTGRIYIQNVDHCNTHSAFDPKQAPIRQSNLCMEITLPTSPVGAEADGHGPGEIALCTLSAFNLGALESLDELAGLADLVVRALDSLLDYQDYPLEAAKRSTLARRPLGVGVINFAHYLAKHGVKYSDGSANALTHRTFEAIQYHLLRASVALAREHGPCPGFSQTSYAQGRLPIDSYKRDLDDICQEPLHYNWQQLRSDIQTHGLRHSTLTALMPSETSSQIANATNGIEPPRALVSVKASKDGILKQVVPELQHLRGEYELLWQMPSNKGYLQLVGLMQKFVDQSISANTNYDPSRYTGNKVPMTELLGDLLSAYKLGVKTLYYHNTRDGAADESATAPQNDCSSGACAI